MSMYSSLKNNYNSNIEEFTKSLDGNLCRYKKFFFLIFKYNFLINKRCTGYRPIIDAAKTISYKFFN